MRRPPRANPHRRLTGATVIACTAIAFANLPTTELPLAWLAAFTLPAVTLARLPARLRGWERVSLAIALQVVACVLAFTWGQPTSRPAGLACTILPPLAFATARLREGDEGLALFLGFCVLLVGAILDEPNAWTLIAWGTCACIVLRATARSTAIALHGNADLPADRGVPAGALIGTALAIAASCVLAAAGIDRALALLPSPSRAGHPAHDRMAAARPDTAASRVIGLDDTFILDGSDIREGRRTRGEARARVRAVDGKAVPRDLYLRSDSFTIAGLDGWKTGPVEAELARGEVTLRAPSPGVATEWLEVECLSAKDTTVFVPPGVVALRAPRDLLVDAPRERVQRPDSGNSRVYQVGWQRLPLSHFDRTSPDAATAELLALPAQFDRAPFDRLLAEWQADGDTFTVAQAIANGLARHCRYERSDPKGPYAHALQNFLFADDRRGYCMHFASAAALMLRSRGIPCRIAIGLHGGDLARGDPLARVYHSGHAHAWVEIPFAGRGFVIFDPTPVAERGDDEAADESTDSWRPEHVLAWFPPLANPWVIGGALLVAGIAAVWLRPRRRHRERAAISPPPQSLSAKRLLVRLLQSLAHAGHARDRGVTLEVFAHELAALGRLPAEIAAAFTAYQQIRFGGRPFDGDRRQALLLGVATAGRMPRDPANGGAADAGSRNAR